jgi:hypothetical protein
MDARQAKDITEKLKGVFPNASHWQMSYFFEEWTKNLLSLNHYKALGALEKAIKTCKYCPNIAEFNELYNSIPFEVVDINIECPICDGRGFVLYTKEWEGRPYEFAAYCDRCEASENFRYDGRTISKDKGKTDFYIEPISNCKTVVRETEPPKNNERFNKTIEMLQQKFNMPEVKFYE